MVGLCPACSNDGAMVEPTDNCEWVLNTPPDAPALLSPVSNRIDVIPETLSLVATQFSDQDGDEHLASEFEILRASSTGTIGASVWRARLDSASSLTTATLADGAFQPGFGALQPWTDYAVRVRYLQAERRVNGILIDDCELWSQWSEVRLFRTDDGSSYLFSEQVIRDLHIDIPPESWAAIDQQARPPGCVPFKRDYQPGSITFDGTLFEGVGIRSKGGCGSARHLDGKTAFKIHLAWDNPAEPGCPDSRRLHGLKRLTLNNMVQDRTFMHEQLGYSLYASLGVPTPRVNYMRVHVNGELWGLYLLQESIDRRFLSRRFASNQGSLYEGTYWCDLLPGNIPPDLEGTYCFSRKFGTGVCSDPSNFDDLAALIHAIDEVPDAEFFERAGEFLELDTFVTMWAVDAQLGHWDGYEFDIMNNYRVYQDPSTSRWTVIPTGIDQTFGRDVNPFAVSGIMARKCLLDSRCAELFIDKLVAVNDAFQAMGFDAQIDELKAWISDDVMADPRKEFGFGQFENQVQGLRNWIAQRPAQMDGYITSARAALQAGESLSPDVLPR